MKTHLIPILLALFITSLSVVAPRNLCAQQPQSSAPLQAIQFKLNRLAPGVTSGQAVFASDQSTMISVDIMANISGLTTSILGPGGQLIDPNAIGSFGGNFSFLEGSQQPDSSLILPLSTAGFHYVYSLPSLGSGNYTVRFQALPSLAQEVAVITQFLTDSKISAHLLVTEPVITLGNPVVLTAAVFDEQSPVPGATVSVSVLPETGSPITVALQDNGGPGDNLSGDGLYSGEFTPASAGKYIALAEIQGSSSNSAFTRQASTEFTVIAPSSRLTGVVQDSGIDDNGDGLFDKVRINAQVQTTQAGKFIAFIHLKTNNGKELVRSTQIDLQNGTSNIPVDFEATAFRELGENGPYIITLIELVFVNQQGSLPADRLENAGQTQAYQLSQFQRPPLLLTGRGSASGIDTNGNGLFDLLKVTIEIDVLTAGNHNWSGRLIDGNGTELGFVSNAGHLNVGLNNLDFTFDGVAIGRNGVDGPYFINSLLVFGAGGSLVASNAFTTGPFLATQFEGSCNTTISCPGPITVAAASTCPVATSSPVNFNVTVSGNCTSATFVCRNQNNVVVTSGSVFPVGTTTVNCAATGASGNTATCSFTVNVFSFCLQDETNPGNFVLINATTGDYIFFCNSSPIASGRGTLTTRGCIGRLDHNKGEGRVLIQWDTTAQSGQGSGTALVQAGVNTPACQITDKDLSNNTCTGAPQSLKGKVGKGQNKTEH